MRRQTWTVAALLAGSLASLLGQAPAQAPAPAAGRGSSGAIQQRVQPPARIMSFTAGQCEGGRLRAAHLGDRESERSHHRSRTGACDSPRKNSSDAQGDDHLHAFDWRTEWRTNQVSYRECRGDNRG